MHFYIPKKKPILFYVLSNESRCCLSPQGSCTCWLAWWEANCFNIYHHLIGHGCPVMIGSDGSTWFPSHSSWQADPAQSMGFYRCDVTSGLPDDINMIRVTLTMGHGQRATPGFLMTSHHVIAYLGSWLTSLLEQWPWQWNADVWCRCHSHP